MKKPVISVLMSAFNSEKFIEKAIKSMLDQTFSNFEFIIFDDGSTDLTYLLIKKYAQDKRLKIIQNKKNKGYVGFINNLNKGLKIAKGKYIARMDSDDVSLPDRLKLQYDFLEKNKDVFLVGSSAFVIDKKDITIGKWNVLTNPSEIKNILFKKNCLIHPSIMFRNKRGMKYWEKALYCEDYDLYLRLVKNGEKLANIALPLIKYRLHETSASIISSIHQRLFEDEVRKINLDNINSLSLRNNFNPNFLLKINKNVNIKKLLVERSISALLGDKQIKIARNTCLNYFRNYGISGAVLKQYIVSFLPEVIKEKIKKTIYN